jgi:hypothetical protein
MSIAIISSPSAGRLSVSSAARRQSLTRARLTFSAALALAFALAFFIPATATPAHATQNTLGTATIAQSTCPAAGLADGTCYRVVIADCPEATADFAAAIKINEPPDTSLLKGTVFFSTGGGGAEYYDDDGDYKGDKSCTDSNCGMMVVQSINTANYRTVQVNFVDPENLIQEPSGWLTGPATDGPRALACRYATLVHAVWSIILKRDNAHPFCATGNSGGGALIAYAITQYGMGTTSGPGPMFTMAEPTSGPPYGRIDHGCAGAAAPVVSASCPQGARISENYGLGTAADYVDPAYPSDVCTVDINSDGKDPYADFIHDSNLSDDYPAPSFKTTVRVLFGSEDLGPAVPLGTLWYNAITSAKSAACITGAPHELPENYDGATTIVSDVTSLCQ